MIYLDAATTVPTSTHVQNRLVETLGSNWGNVSGAHQISRNAKNMLELARENCSKVLGVAPDEVIFTSGATEAINIVMQGFARSNPDSKIFYSAIEHPAVSKTAKYLESMGTEVSILNVDSNGILDFDSLDRVNPGDLVCIMPVNNEIGVVNDVKSISEKVHSKSGLVLLDCVQSFYAFRPSDLCTYADFAVFSGHKLGAPQGVGLLVAKDRKKIMPLSFGGSQEWELRPGTTPAYLADAFAFVFENALDNRDLNIEHLKTLQEVCIDAISKNLSRSTIHCNFVETSPHIVAIDVGDIESQMLVPMVDSRGICVSRGSACASGAQTPSPVLLALGIPESKATSTLRLSFHPGTTQEEVKNAIEVIGDCVNELQSRQKVSK